LPSGHIEPEAAFLKYLVTGATSGIGLCIVGQLANAGHEIVATGRRPASQLPGSFPDVAYIQLDLSSGTSVHDSLGPSIARIDRAVLCAGTGYYRSIEDETPGDVDRVISVNFRAVAEICRAVYSPLLETRGRLALIGSVARHGSSKMPVYSASKAALRGFSRSLQSEWAGRIRVCHLDPWATRTPMHERAGLSGPPAGFLLMDPADVAAAILWRMERSGDGVHAICPATIAAMRLGRLGGRAA
jgi:hypothetical protein